MKMGWKRKLGPVLLGLAIAAPTMAEDASTEKSPETVRLDEIVVTATKTERRSETLPVSVGIINEEDIARSAAYRTDDLLRELPGVYVRSYQGILSSSTTNDVGIRGLTGEDRVLVLKNGIPINDPYGGAVEFNEVDIADIKKIEIVRGPGSALYGSNAMGSVINIVTKKPDEGIQTSAKIGYGDMNTWTGSAANSGGFGKFGYYVSGNYLKSDGYIDVVEENRKPYHTEKEVERYNLSGKLYYAPDDTSSLALSLAHYDQEDTGRQTCADGHCRFAC